MLVLFCASILSVPPEILPAENSVCRVVVEEGNGVKSHGSGVLVLPPDEYQKNDKEYVITAYHVVRDRLNGRIYVTWDGVTRYEAKMVASRPGCDCAVLTVLKGMIPEHIPRIKFADEDIKIGETCYTLGFGDATNNILKNGSGKAVRYSLNTYNDRCWFDCSNDIRQGDSGGPVLVIRNGEVRFIGNVWGDDNNTTSANRLTVVRRLFGLEVAPTNPSTVRNGYQPVTITAGGT